MISCIEVLRFVFRCLHSLPSYRNIELHTYKQQSKPKQNKADDWDVPDPVPAPRRRGAARKAAPRRRAAAREFDNDDGDDDEDNDDNDKKSSSSNSNSSGSSSSSSSGSTSSSGSRSKPEVEVEPDVHERGVEPGVHEHDVERDVGVVVKAAPKARGRAAGAKRDDQNAFGICWITPRRAVGIGTTGFQASCTNPDHQVDGRCTKEISISRHGSEDIALRRLKAWIVLYGATSASADRAAHRVSWSRVSKMEDGKDLPADADLDALAPADWAESGGGAEPAAEPAAEPVAEGAKKRRRRS